MKRLHPQSVATRLYLGLALLAALVLVASIIGASSFQQTQKTFDHIASIELSAMRDASALQNATRSLSNLAPSLVAKKLDQGALLAFTTQAYSTQVEIQSLIVSLGKLLDDKQLVQIISDSSNALFQNADALATAIYDKAATEQELKQKIAEVVSIRSDARRYLASTGRDDPASLQIERWLGTVDASGITILKAIAYQERDQLSTLGIDMSWQLADANRIASEDTTAAKQLTELQDRLMKAASGSRGVIALQQALLTNSADMELLLQKNDQLAQSLEQTVSSLVDKIRDDVQLKSKEFGVALWERSNIMLALAALGALAAVAVAIYFYRSVIRRLTKLRNAMMNDEDLQKAQGLAHGRDEIAEMASSVLHYVEAIRKRDSEIETSQRRLTDAIESLEDGFSLYDPQDRLVASNASYAQLLYPGMEESVRPGQPFADIVRRAAEGGLIPTASGRVEEWLAERLLSHKTPVGKVVQQRADGRWIEIKERKTDDGDTVAIYSDITDQRRSQIELMEVLERVKDQNLKLESLSTKLSKYLSPQIYSTIFSGHRTVELSSTRKKLTVFFSDISGFTEIADTIESEELTTLLNHYLTEMSQIALAHGATIDKFIGDAIVIFFGDPETRGTKQDALACVEMAIAMQRRMRELQTVWSEQGVEQPFQLRIGITTGYCTVGNFGSADRMDYTIIGSEVNLAARLQTHVELGGILLAHETYSLVKDRIAAEERDPIAFKGFSKPVKTYRVIGTRDVDATINGVIHHESDGARIHVDIANLTPACKEQIRRTALKLLSVTSD